MKAGDVVRVALSQADGQHKVRPAVLVAAFPPFGDWMVVGISGSLGLEVSGFDIVIDEDHSSFKQMRLGYAGLIRLGHAHVIPVPWTEGVIGSVDPAILQMIRERLAARILSG